MLTNLFFAKMTNTPQCIAQHIIHSLHCLNPQCQRDGCELAKQILKLVDKHAFLCNTSGCNTLGCKVCKLSSVIERIKKKNADAESTKKQRSGSISARTLIRIIKTMVDAKKHNELDALCMQYCSRTVSKSHLQSEMLRIVGRDVLRQAVWLFIGRRAKGPVTRSRSRALRNL